MKCWVGSLNPVKINAGQTALRSLPDLKDITAVGLSVPSGVPDQPMTENETREGAVNRLQRLIELPQVSKDDWLVSIEGGVHLFEYGPATFAYVCIGHNQRQTVGRSPNLPIPNSVYQALLSGEELGDVMDQQFKTVNIKQKGGAIGLLTDHKATRESVYSLTLNMALAPFRFPHLYEH